MGERPIVAELRAVDAALTPLAPSRALAGRIDALLAGRAPPLAHRRLLVGALGACAAVAAMTLWLGRGDETAIARAPTAAPAATPQAPAASPASVTPSHSSAPSMPAPTPTPAGAPGGAPRAIALEAPTLALVDGATPMAAPPALSASARTVGLELPMAREAVAPDSAAPRREVRRAATSSAALVARSVGDADDPALEHALAALRADKARGDLAGALLRIDGLLAVGVGLRADAILRIERARLQERLGDRIAACAGLAGLRGDDARDARLRLSCP